MGTKSFKDLVVWQKSRDLGIIIYQLTGEFPASEMYGLTSQMRRAAVSISSNIAESYHRFQPKEKRQFLVVAFGSGAELESQIDLAKILFPKLEYQECEALLREVMRILNRFITR